MIGFSFETISVGNRAQGLTSSVYTLTGPKAAESAFITCEGSSIRYTYHGSNPTTLVGHVLPEGGFLVLKDIRQISKFRAISIGETEATLTATYERQ